MTGTELIAAERQRQVEQEGWTPEHDAEHKNDDLAWAAVCYVLPLRRNVLHNMTATAGMPSDRGDRYRRCPEDWPWSPDDWKPTGDRVRDLVKAGALIAAEIDRLLAGGAA